jgi:hypothetical protein
VARNKKSNAGGLMVAALALAVLALAGSWAWARFGGLRAAPRFSKQARVIRVQILNGSGETGVGGRVATFLRDGGFQVVDVRNADRSDYFASIVVARRTDLSPAREVAHYLGGPPVIRQAWESDLADVSVIIGSDRSRLQIEP